MSETTQALVMCAPGGSEFYRFEITRPQSSDELCLVPRDRLEGCLDASRSSWIGGLGGLYVFRRCYHTLYDQNWVASGMAASR